jgi:hypothetical protein
MTPTKEMLKAETFKINLKRVLDSDPNAGYPDAIDLDRIQRDYNLQGKIDLREFRAAFMWWWETKRFGKRGWVDSDTIRRVAEKELGFPIHHKALLAAFYEWGIQRKGEMCWVPVKFFYCDLYIDCS